MSQEQQKKAPSFPVGQRSADAPRSQPITGLKLVTLTANESFHDAVPEPIAEEGGIAPKVDPYIGCTIDNRYKVEEVLGEGGMGVVYRCRHKIIDKKVAMKVLRADMARDKEVTERFLIEAKAASAIGNQHIIDISDFGQLPDGSTYFVMEYLDGVSLSKIVEDQMPVPVPRILHIARQLAEGLSAAHDAGIVHRDLKPDNIYLVPRGTDKDFVKILDFGIAKVSSGATGKLTRAGSVFGTPHYMSPEQAAGAPVDHRGDIYSFGVILYELSCGKVPFDADNFMGILTQHMYKAPVPIRALVPPPQDIPPGLEAIILKCLSKRAEQRYENMLELIADIDKVKAGLVPAAVGEMMARSGGFNVPADFFKKQGIMPEPLPATPAGLKKSRWPLYAGIAGVLAAVGIVAAIFANSASSPASMPPAVTQAAEPPVAQPAAPPPVEQKPVEPAAGTEVVLAVDPLDAVVFQGNRSLGNSPVVVQVPAGQTVELTVKKAGYVEQSVVLDGTEKRKAVALQPVKRAAPPRAASRAAPKPSAQDTSSKGKTKPTLGGGEIVNPWAH